VVAIILEQVGTVGMAPKFIVKSVLKRKIGLTEIA